MIEEFHFVRTKRTERNLSQHLSVIRQRVVKKRFLQPSDHRSIVHQFCFNGYQFLKVDSPTVLNSARTETFFIATIPTGKHPLSDYSGPL